MSETRTRRRIRKAVESRGFAVEELIWETPYDCGEKMGYGGGWSLQVDRPYAPNTFPGDELYGLSVEEVLADIDWSLRPTEECDCAHAVDERPGRHPLTSIKGDPQRELHQPDCRWHLGYHLRWWPAPVPHPAAADPSDGGQADG